VPCDQAANTCTISVPAPCALIVYLTPQALSETTPSTTQTFPTTFLTKTQNTATVPPSVLSTSNGHSGSAWKLGSTSKETQNGARGVVIPGMAALVAMVWGAMTVSRVLTRWILRTCNRWTSLHTYLAVVTYTALSFTICYNLLKCTIIRIYDHLEICKITLLLLFDPIDHTSAFSQIEIQNPTLIYTELRNALVTTMSRIIVVLSTKHDLSSAKVQPTLAAFPLSSGTKSLGLFNVNFLFRPTKFKYWQHIYIYSPRNLSILLSQELT